MTLKYELNNGFKAIVMDDDYEIDLGDYIIVTFVDKDYNIAATILFSSVHERFYYKIINATINDGTLYKLSEQFNDKLIHDESLQG